MADLDLAHSGTPHSAACIRPPQQACSSNGVRAAGKETIHG
ncbi:hypothetical protein predicted by Glimmer/Critica [Azoarcus olearius]|uniref:Uncharacterized protein n=1 Tax=Azoarcus sp. (strain BH72) TaxID=418699 RepID=A1K6Z1_AZOSB|nr:hypothetical protein predicted by Glimmer/Critica [Azoarcus olearius]